MSMEQNQPPERYDEDRAVTIAEMLGKIAQYDECNLAGLFDRFKQEIDDEI